MVDHGERHVQLCPPGNHQVVGEVGRLEFTWNRTIWMTWMPWHVGVLSSKPAALPQKGCLNIKEWIELNPKPKLSSFSCLCQAPEAKEALEAPAQRREKSLKEKAAAATAFDFSLQHILGSILTWYTGAPIKIIPSELNFILGVLGILTRYTHQVY